MRKFFVAFVLFACAATAWADMTDGPASVAKALLPPNVQTGAYGIHALDCYRPMVQMGTGTTAQSTITLPASTDFINGCRVKVKNGDIYTGANTGHAMTLSGFPTDLVTNLWPQQVLEIVNTPSGWQTSSNPGRWKLNATVNMYVRPDGNDSNDGLTNSSGSAFLTANGAFNTIAAQFDINNQTMNVNHTCGSPPCTITAAAQLLSLVETAFVGGTPAYRGDCTTPTNVKLQPSTSVAADILIDLSGGSQPTFNVCGFELAGGANVAIGVYSSGTANVMFNSLMQCDGMSAASGEAGFPAGACYVAANGGHLVLEANNTIAGNVGTVLSAYNGGVIEAGTATTWTLTGTPAWGSDFIHVYKNGSANVPSMTFSGSATGSRFTVQWGGFIGTGLGTCAAASTYFPGNSNGTIGDTTGNRGNCF